MNTYLYKVKSGPEKIIEGTITASSSDEAVDKLYQKGYVVISIKDVCAEETSENKNHFLFSKVSFSEITVFTNQLARLLDAGVPMLQALNIMSQQVQNNYFKYAILDIADKIKSGLTFSQSLEKYPRIFPYFYVSMIGAGEESGSVNESLARISRYYIKQQQVSRKIKNAMAYPIFILITGVATVVFVFTNVLPKIMPVITNMKMELPFPTRILLAVSAFVKAYWFWILVIIITFYLIARKSMSKPAYVLHLSEIKKNIPIFGNIIYKSELSRFLRSMEVSLRNGVNIMEALKLSVLTLNEVYIKEKISLYINEIQQGENISEVFKKTGLFPAFSIAAVKIGEESGSLPDSLSDVSDMLESECEDAIGLMVSIIEPVMILVIGLIVGFMISAVLLPVFQVTDIQF